MASFWDISLKLGMKMDLKSSLLLLLCFAGSTSGQFHTTPEGKRRAIRCYTDMNKNADITTLLLNVTTPKQINYFCSRISNLMKCVADNEHHLTNGENAEYLRRTRSVRKFYLNVCPPGSDITERYKGNAPCFQLIKDHVLYCASELSDVEGPQIRGENKHTCCALGNHRACVTNATSENCGKEAGEVVREILLRYFEPEKIGCREIRPEDCWPASETTTVMWKPKDRRVHRGRLSTPSSTPEDEWSPTTLKDDKSPSTFEEEWSPTTVADHWRRHKGKSGTSALCSSWVGVLLAAFGLTFLNSLMVKMSSTAQLRR